MAARKKKGRRKPDPHPEEELAGLEAALREGIPPAVVLRGEERYFRDEGVRRVVAAATARGDEVCRHDGKDPEFSLPRLLDDLTGGALFATARTVVLQRADGRINKGARDHAPGLVEALKARLASGQPGCVVIGAEKLRADHAVLKAAIAAGGRLVTCRKLWATPPPFGDPDPRRAELVQWLLARARERRVELTPDEAVYLVQAVGADLSELLGRLDVLRDRGGEALRELVGWTSGASPWDVAEHLIAGDAARAAAGVEALFQGGFEGRDGERTVGDGAVVTVLSIAITAKARQAAAGAGALAAGLGPKEVVALAGVKGPPGVQQRFLERLRLRSPAEWNRLLEEAADLERRSRSGALVDANDLARLALHWARRRRR